MIEQKKIQHQQLKKLQGRLPYLSRLNKDTTETNTTRERYRNTNTYTHKYRERERERHTHTQNPKGKFN
jgi:hypothetical protein